MFGERIGFSRIQGRMRAHQDERGQMKIAQDAAASTVLISWELIFVPSPFADSNEIRDVGIRFRNCENDYLNPRGRSCGMCPQPPSEGDCSIMAPSPSSERRHFRNKIFLKLPDCRFLDLSACLAALLLTLTLTGNDCCIII